MVMSHKFQVGDIVTENGIDKFKVVDIGKDIILIESGHADCGWVASRYFTLVRSVLRGKLW